MVSYPTKSDVFLKDRVQFVGRGKKRICHLPEDVLESGFLCVLLKNYGILMKIGPLNGEWFENHFGKQFWPSWQNLSHVF